MNKEPTQTPLRDAAPVVYIVQRHLHRGTSGELEPKFDETPARRFGELVYLLSPNAKPFETTPILFELHEKLKEYDPAKDFILLTGNPVLIGLTVTIAFHFGLGKARFLQWNGSKGEYTPIDAQLPLTNTGSAPPSPGDET